MKPLIALDAGGTSVRAALIEASGNVILLGMGGRANPVSSGIKLASDAIVLVVSEMLTTAGLRGIDIDSVTICSAGVSLFRDDDLLKKRFYEAGIVTDIRLRSDVLAAFCSGAVELSGYGVVSGTGAVAIRVENGEIVAVADGMGWLLGDEGSGYQIGKAVARAAVADLDHRGPATDLTPALLDELQITPDPRPDLDGKSRTLLMLGKVLFRRAPIELAAFAPLAFQFPDDAVAVDLIAVARSRLQNTLEAVLDPDIPGPVVLSGSVLTKQPLMATAISDSLSARELAFDVRRVGDGLVGAIIVALRTAGVTVDRDLHEYVTATIATSRQAGAEMSG